MYFTSVNKRACPYDSGFTALYVDTNTTPLVHKPLSRNLFRTGRRARVLIEQTTLTHQEANRSWISHLTTIG